MKLKLASAIAIMAGFGMLASCKNEAIPNPNAPSMEEIIKNPTLTQLNSLIIGTESSMRNRLEIYIDAVSVLGREYYRHSGSDPRWTDVILGKDATVLPAGGFFASIPWDSRYNVVKNCNLLLQGIENSKYFPNANVKNGYSAFTKTIKAYQLMLILNGTHDNGIRLEVTDPYNPGPIVTRAVALEAIATMLNEADGLLANAEFSFPLSAGFEGFETPANFRKFNRALAARVAVYRERWADALTILPNSFLSMTAGASLTTGPKHIYSLGTNDQVNELFLQQDNEDEIQMAHPSYITAMEAGDDRIGKARLRAKAIAFEDLSGTHEMRIFKTQTDPIGIIRNEELVLLFAEASAQTNALPAAADAVNFIRTSHGLTARLDLDTKDKLIDEILKQRRFSLWGEGHRWIDMRRYNRLNQLPVDRTGDKIWSQIPVPLSENSK
ncbi:RagB/SusD family nutrient uptake outer membrane protein [Chitinophaga deserti]|uniref:RagB/SusD family nutrient uptake outer membrane protein n=1 Tax=Chitinophaga deserti TaxID=2164099 RepID=UPI000D6D2779|nr:RagB/SusD family nutrient uptake outer membrane protein [Chitinophaga deserti]